MPPKTTCADHQEMHHAMFGDGKSNKGLQYEFYKLRDEYNQFKYMVAGGWLVIGCVFYFAKVILGIKI